MRNFLLLISFVISFELYALECNNVSFAEGDLEVKKIHFLYNSATQPVPYPTDNDTANFTTEAYKNRLNELEQYLADLTKNHSDLFKARLLNQENLQRWKLLEKTCENESLTLAQKGRYDAETMKPLIQTHMSSVQEHINTMKIIMAAIKQKFEKSREKQ
ncbi:MAG: hypothetical protein M0P91_13675 [Sulfuricurvum sp.]|jgi:hypothetical protein|uniref:hypothetical protein n=1 Tax=Sulfuricurvum sp. TaxID=2025608 RepID=UPI0025FC0192|nr:hypothetical protein [Sulfuricurvum sp.]MCK9374226.1 hypothetical protein [Sulfuricurvum sp.]